MINTNTVFAAIAAAFAFLTIAAPASAGLVLLNPAAQDDTADKPAGDLPDTSDWELIHEGTIKKVTVRNPETGEEGCHNHDEGVSTPGAC